eukprot:1111262-Amphidinium_carterae.1
MVSEAVFLQSVKESNLEEAAEAHAPETYKRMTRIKARIAADAEDESRERRSTTTGKKRIKKSKTYRFD